MATRPDAYGTGRRRMSAHATSKASSSAMLRSRWMRWKSDEESVKTFALQTVIVDSATIDANSHSGNNRRSSATLRYKPFKKRTTMRTVLALAISFFALTAFGQQMTLEQWNEEAKTNIRLLPKYGYAEKTEAQQESDQEFIETSLKQDSTHRKASDHLISLGFRYLYRDVKTAMYRFNQAYLLDSTNTDIYWGFGAVYMTLGDYSRAAEQYLEGLAIDPDNTRLLTDYGTYFMAQYYGMEPIDKARALTHLETAISYLTKSYNLDPTDQNTTFKLSICYWNKGDCGNAWKYYDICKEHGGQPITEDFTKDLMKKCKRKK